MMALFWQWWKTHHRLIDVSSAVLALTALGTSLYTLLA